MENNELQNIWKSIDSEINQKSKDELNLLLISKSKQTINRYLVIIGISILICIGLLIFLTITSLNRQNDFIYIVNNATLGIISIISIISGLLSWYKLQTNKYDQPLKIWLQERVNILSKWFTGKFSRLYLFIIPFLYILIILSIHVYFENKTFIEVLNSEESVFGLIAAIPIGLFVSYLGAIKIRKYQLKKLEFLRDLYNRLSKVH